ncbi:hypothetical protein [Streptomyces luteocolor]|uniref:hypothetical protein n=1 Tax=Streptomyces luteocolor TaxID=285500 RepID=UPI0008530D7D|nr:hypothetical protein [Streptomyces luteocolor]
MDPRRRRYTGQRTAPYAALWLLARIERAGGPFTPLTDPQRSRIGAVAAGAAEHVERALDIATQRRMLEQRQEILCQLHEEDVRARRRLAARLTGWCLLLAALITTWVAARL